MTDKERAQLVAYILEGRVTKSINHCWGRWTVWCLPDSGRPFSYGWADNDKDALTCAINAELDEGKMMKARG